MIMGGGFIARAFHAAATTINQQIKRSQHSFNQHAHCRHDFRATAERPDQLFDQTCWYKLTLLKPILKLLLPESSG
jgi:hypothetical protein